MWATRHSIPSERVRTLCFLLKLWIMSIMSVLNPPLYQGDLYMHVWLFARQHHLNTWLECYLIMCGLVYRYDEKIRQALKPSAQGPKSPPRSPPLPNQQFGVSLSVYVVSSPSNITHYKQTKCQCCSWIESSQDSHVFRFLRLFCLN